MIGLLIITHEALGKAYVRVAEHFFGDVPPHLRIISVKKNDAPEWLREEVASSLQVLDSGNGVLVLGDIFGATPCNSAQNVIQNQVIQHKKVIMLTGLNVPMAVKALQYSGSRTDLSQLAEEVKTAAINGIVAVKYEE
ncbi:PTS sugar transporter subunit IIA [Stenoxybacter acetivorans]|uniref:PTS sugar transporter subunit IIA n=1 Tax=Stenoxybacter acetivorans TaxID=422441 RepID=UPI00056A8F46|nr:hypothetical protein [Stenoxybacter acetivorans]